MVLFKNFRRKRMEGMIMAGWQLLLLGYFLGTPLGFLLCSVLMASKDRQSRTLLVRTAYIETRRNALFPISNVM